MYCMINVNAFVNKSKIFGKYTCMNVIVFIIYK